MRLAISLFVLGLLATPAMALSKPAGAVPPNPTPTPMASSPLLDQEQPVVNGGLSVRYGPSQSVTVGIAGSLVQVDLALCSPMKNSDIVLTVTGSGSPSPSTTASITFKHSYSDCAWYPFVFSQPLSVTVGEVLVLTVTTKNHKAALWGKDGLGNDPYPYGTGTWRGRTINDFAFRTYVQ